MEARGIGPAFNGTRDLCIRCTLERGAALIIADCIVDIDMLKQQSDCPFVSSDDCLVALIL